ncbi:MAG: hypothetical protein Fur0037_04650 [Planctomycetota bacterium]
MHLDAHPAGPVPADPDHLLRLARSTAGRVLRDPILIEEAGERALHKYFLVLLRGEPPLVPEAWIRVVARRFAQSLQRRKRPLEVPFDMDLLPEQPHASAPRDKVERILRDVRPLLTPRQSEVLDAAITTRSMRDAARTCGMSPRDLRRSLGSVGRKCRARLRQREPEGERAVS